MKIQSLAFRTDLIFPRFEGKVIDHGEYLVVETPHNPTYFYGNFLLFPKPPQKNDHVKWLRLFQQEFEHNPFIKHVTLCWDGTRGDSGEIQPFVKDGFKFERAVVLTASKVGTPRRSWEELEVRPLETDDEWQAAVENQIECRREIFDPLKYREFKIKQMQGYWRMVKAGLGHWFGGFHQGRLIADLGIFLDKRSDEENVGRFQTIGTHPDFRRKGACSTLISRASQYVIANHQTQTLVMVADPQYHAARLYESLGFKPTEHQTSLCRS